MFGFGPKYQGKLTSVYYSVGKNPLADWAVQCKYGELRTIQDDVLMSNVLEIVSQNVAACSITTPANPKDSLHIKQPFITLLIKNIDRFFTFEITILDDQNIRRRFRASNYQTATRLSTFMCSMPLCLAEGWSQVQFNLADFTARTFSSKYMETVRIQIHANCRLRRVYFSNQLYTSKEVPDDFNLFKTKTVREKPKKSTIIKKTVAAKKKNT